MVYKFLRKIRLFSESREESFFLLKDILGFKPKNLQLYKLALIHKSSSLTDNKGNVLNNERLEFLGDAVLDAIVADLLYKQYPGQNEGFLTNARSKIVSRTHLNKIAVEIGLNKVVVSTTNSHTHNIFGNAFEALLGAIYLDQGYRKCNQFIVNKVFTGILDVEEVTSKEVNFKSRLLEWSQKNKRELDFVLIEERISNQNTPAFISQVMIDGELYGVGEGNSKKESHQNAAENALKELSEENEL